MPTIRLATEDDADPIRRIYAPFCAGDSHVSFEVEPPTSEEIARRIAKILKGYPWLVAEEAGEVLGYAYAGPHRDRAAYVWSVDVAVYIDPARRGSGVGRALYTSLFAALPLQGFVNAYAGVALPNPASVGLHRAVGFEPVGTYRGVGYKAGEWRDVAWFERLLREPPDRPEPPIKLAEASQLPGWTEALGAGLPLLVSGRSRVFDGPQPGIT
jgi:phosphinothricin acetyltransferase